MALTFEISDIAYIEKEQGQLSQALADYQQVETIRSELAAADPKNQHAHRSLAETESRIGSILWDMGRREAAMAAAQKALALREVLAANDAKDLGMQIDLARSYLDFGDYYATSASESRAAAADRLALWRRARDFYRRAQQITAAVKAREDASAPNLPFEQNVAEGMTKCERAIAQLTQN